MGHSGPSAAHSRKSRVLRRHLPTNRRTRTRDWVNSLTTSCPLWSVQAVEFRFHKLHPFFFGDLAAPVRVHHEQEFHSRLGCGGELPFSFTLFSGRRRSNNRRFLALGSAAFTIFPAKNIAAVTGRTSAQNLCMIHLHLKSSDCLKQASP